MAGTGKSTIARTVAHRFHEKGRLGASFFFSKGKKDLGDASALFTTLAIQLTEVVPDLKRYICDAITQYGDIGQQSLHNQWEHLILHPLLMLDRSLLLPLVLVFVIDALDECESEGLPSILQLLTKVKELKVVQVRVFITSRPEIPVRLGFRKIADIAHYDLMLHSVPQLVIEHDISIFLRHELAKIKEHKSLEEDWPGEADVQKLVKKSGRLFIYAATACRFLSKSPLPKKRLSEMLQVDSTSHSSTKELDEMYKMILTNLIIEGQDEDNKDVVRLFKQIVGSIVILFDSLPGPALTELLAVLPDEVNATLEPLRSVLNVPEDKASPIQLFHLSFRDFLLDENRCPDQFWIDERTVHSDLLVHCLKLMSEHLRRDMCELGLPGALASEVERGKVEQYLPLNIQYACRYWVYHLQRSKIDIYDNGQVHIFLQKHFLHWLEALSLIGNLSDGIGVVRTFESILIVSDSINSCNSLTS
jgi:NACHT domain